MAGLWSWHRGDRYILLPFFRVVPAASRPSTLPGLTLVTIVMALVAIACYKILLLNTVPAIAAKIGGSEVALSYPILMVNPNRSSQYCSRSVHIGTDVRPVKLCNFSKEKFESLKQSEILQIKGKSTWMGQAVSVIDAPG